MGIDLPIDKVLTPWYSGCSEPRILDKESVEMPGSSTRTVVVGVRLPVAAVKKVKDRAAKRGMTVSMYVSGLIVHDALRKR